MTMIQGQDKNLGTNASVVAFPSTKAETPSATATQQSVQRQCCGLAITPKAITIKNVIVTMRKTISIREGFHTFPRLSSFDA